MLMSLSTEKGDVRSAAQPPVMQTGLTGKTNGDIPADYHVVTIDDSIHVMRILAHSQVCIWRRRLSSLGGINSTIKRAMRLYIAIVPATEPLPSQATC